MSHTQTSQKVSASVSKCHHFFWQVLASGTKGVGKCRQVAEKFSRSVRLRYGAHLKMGIQRLPGPCCRPNSWNGTWGRGVGSANAPANAVGTPRRVPAPVPQESGVDFQSFARAKCTRFASDLPFPPQSTGNSANYEPQSGQSTGIFG